jgi:hypothetical protein
MCDIRGNADFGQAPLGSLHISSKHGHLHFLYKKSYRFFPHLLSAEIQVSLSIPLKIRDCLLSLRNDDNNNAKPYKGPPDEKVILV